MKRLLMQRVYAQNNLLPLPAIAMWLIKKETEWARTGIQTSIVRIM